MNGKLPPELTFQLARGLVDGMQKRQHTPFEALAILFTAVSIAVADSADTRENALAGYDYFATTTRKTLVKMLDEVQAKEQRSG